MNIWIFRTAREPEAFPIVYDELFNKGRLRQGWGIPGLNLRIPLDAWVANYVGYWGEPEAQATDRWNILSPMLEMEKGDIIIIPRVHIVHTETLTEVFTMGVVAEGYLFEDRTHFPEWPDHDFGHILLMKDLKSYYYTETSIPGPIAAPFLMAVNRVGRDSDWYNTIRKFVETIYGY
jgi:hypothetical protein